MLKAPILLAGADLECHAPRTELESLITGYFATARQAHYRFRYTDFVPIFVDAAGRIL